MRSIRLIALLLLLTAWLTSRAQLYRNDFDNGYAWYPPWENLVLAADSTHPERGLVCICDSTREFGLEFKSTFDDSLGKNNLRLRFDADFRFPDTVGTGEIALTITKGNETRYWVSYPLSDYAADSARWFHVNIEANLPNDYLEGSLTKLFLWNRYHSRVIVDNAEIELTPWTLPSFLPAIQRDSITEDSFVLRPDDPLQAPVTYPIGMLTEYILNGDTVTEYQLFKKPKDTKTDLFEFIAVSAIDTTLANHVGLTINATTIFSKEAKLLRKTLVVPFIDSTLTVYRRNMVIDTSLFQSEYYLDREGFQVGEGERSIISYHQNWISSTQLDADHRIAYFNLDYWRDHPMIHYPLRDTSDYFEDISYRTVESSSKWINWIELNIGDDIKNLPRIMSIPNGYESGIIFTEHADWSDIRTHRATYFGSESITKPSKAIGGYVYYGIPVTKSVFYNNPDQITNNEVSHGAFPGLHATIQTDRNFAKFLKQLDRQGYEICLHTPEQYTTTPTNLAEAMKYMRRHFNTVSWIDHGYNNGPEHNREDLVCDGLTLSANLWKENGVQYLWNAYYEENRMEEWCFDNNLTQPYPGFGDALPNRQVTTITGFDHSCFAGLAPTFELEFLAWATPSTLDITREADWDYYYSKERLQRIVDNHNVHITHVYSPWVWPGRTFWTYDADSTIVAQPGMNRALKRIADLRDEHKMLPMTVKTYLDHLSNLQKVDYTIVDSCHICISNFGPNEIKGFTLLCSSPIRFEDNRFYEYRKSGNEYYIWFDLKANDKVNIEIKDSVF
ncbi:MAG: hypothetical protein IKM85_08665 [Bacteroidales bacterium]|nr:hypothetical protein [Bacteroidales bacterium]